MFHGNDNVFFFFLVVQFIYLNPNEQIILVLLEWSKTEKKVVGIVRSLVGRWRIIVSIYIFYLQIRIDTIKECDVREFIFFYLLFQCFLVLRILCHRNLLIFSSNGPLLWHKSINGIKRFTFFYSFLFLFFTNMLRIIYFSFFFQPSNLPLHLILFLLVSEICHSIWERKRENVCVRQSSFTESLKRKSGCVYCFHCIIIMQCWCR